MIGTVVFHAAGSGEKGYLNGDGRLDVFNGSRMVQTPYAGAFTPTNLTFTQAVGLTSLPKRSKFTNTGELPIKIISVSTAPP